MHTDPVLPARRPRSWIAWSLVLTAIALPSLVIWSIVSCFGLDSDAAALRDAVIGSDRDVLLPKVELRLGWVPLALIRMGLRPSGLEPEVRWALESVRSVEVGVYASGGGEELGEAKGPLAASDAALRPLHWDRTVGVVHEGAVVGVYSRENKRDLDALHFCVLVRHQNCLVVAAVRCRAQPLVELAQEVVRRDDPVKAGRLARWR